MSARSRHGSRDLVDAPIKALRDPAWKTRWQAAQVLGELQDARAVEPLVQALEDPNQWVRVVAAEALGQIGDRQATRALVRLVGDQSIWVRRASVVALGQIGDERAVSPLVELLLAPPDDEWPAELHDTIARALGAIGGPAVPVLEQALSQLRDRQTGELLAAARRAHPPSDAPGLNLEPQASESDQDASRLKPASG